MNGRHKLVMVVGFAGILFATSLSAFAEGPNLSNKWRIEVSEGANSDGMIRFLVTPEGGQPVEVNVPIKDGRGENGVARDISKVFKGTLDKEWFSAETDDGEDVLVKKRKGPNFELKLVESSVKSVRIHVEKE